MTGTDDLLGRGWRHPVVPDEGRLRLEGGAAKVAQSLWQILATTPGERLLRPTFGCGIHELVFAPNTATLRGQVADRVRQAIVAFEARVDLVDLTVESPPGQETLLEITIAYRIRATNQVHNLVYPFFLQEGDAARAGTLLRPGTA
jgi:phage baseplate assembly protein W